MDTLNEGATPKIKCPRCGFMQDWHSSKKHCPRCGAPYTARVGNRVFEDEL